MTIYNPSKIITRQEFQDKFGLLDNVIEMTRVVNYPNPESEFNYQAFKIINGASILTQNRFPSFKEPCQMSAIKIFGSPEEQRIAKSLLEKTLKTKLIHSNKFLFQI